MLTATNVSLHVDNKTLLDHISLELSAGEVMVVIGPNGAGKSSLIKSLTSEVDASGSVKIDGRDWHEIDALQRARRIAILPQASTLQFAFTVQEVVALGRFPHNSGSEKDQEVVKQTLQACDATHLAKRFYPELSGGEKQRVQLARVMAQIWPDEDSSSSRYLLLDEPTSALDIAHEHQILRAVKTLCRHNIGVLVVLHDLNLAAQYADQVVTLHEGRLVEQGTAKQVLSKSNIERVFGCKVLVQQHPETGRPLVIYSS